MTEKKETEDIESCEVCNEPAEVFRFNANGYKVCVDCFIDEQIEFDEERSLRRYE